MALRLCGLLFYGVSLYNGLNVCVLHHDSQVEAITLQCDGIYLITCIKQLNIAHINGIWEVLRVR